MDADKQADMEMVEKHVQQLAEHFDTVHIFTTRYVGETESTRSVQTGCGNYFARYGQAVEWVAQKDEEARIQERFDEEDDE